MSKRDPIPTRYTHEHLRFITNAQQKALDELKAKCIKLSIFGSVHAASKRKLYIIERNGQVSMSTRAYAKW